MRLLICGSRGWHDPAPINALLAGYDILAEGRGETLTVIHGGGRGADALADSLAKQWGARVIREDANWDAHGKAAGPIRNTKMLTEHKPDIVWAFRTSGKSSGTDDMVTKARKAGVPTYIVAGGDHVAAPG